jgi:hypothetical protein
MGNIPGIRACSENHVQEIGKTSDGINDGLERARVCVELDARKRDAANTIEPTA